MSLVAAGRAGFAACDPTQDPDRSDIANARAFVADRCDCDAATSHGAYVKCAVEQASAALQNGSCAGAVKRCAARSTCGRPGFVTCCVTTAKGTRCGIKRDAAHCRAPRNGTACADHHHDHDTDPNRVHRARRAAPLRRDLPRGRAVRSGLRFHALHELVRLLSQRRHAVRVIRLSAVRRRVLRERGLSGVPPGAGQPRRHPDLRLRGPGTELHDLAYEYLYTGPLPAGRRVQLDPPERNGIV